MEKTHIALPHATFQKVMNVLASLPYGQISAVIDEIRSSGAEVDISAPETGEKEEE